MRTSTALTILIAGVFGLVWAFGQDPPTLRVDVSLVTVDVEVTDSTGRAINTLKKEDFQILENGSPQDIRSFDSVETPYNIMLLFDCSSSTEPAWPFLFDAMNRFGQTLRSQDRLAVAQFGSKFKSLRKLASRAEAPIDVAVQPHDPVCDGTNFYGAMERALDDLKLVKGRRGVVILTDGEHDNIPQQKGSQLLLNRPRFVDAVDDKDFQKVLRSVKGSGVSFYFVAVNTDLNPNEFYTEEIYNRQQLRSRMELLSGGSGGRVAYPKKPDEVVKLYEQLAHDLGTSYSLGYVPENMAKDGAFRKIEVRLRDQTLRVRQSREGYTPQ